MQRLRNNLKFSVNDLNVKIIVTYLTWMTYCTWSITLGMGVDKIYKEMKNLENLHTVGRILVGWDPVSSPSLLGACGNSLSPAPDRTRTCNSLPVDYDSWGIRMSIEGDLIGPIWAAGSRYQRGHRWTGNLISQPPSCPWTLSSGAWDS